MAAPVDSGTFITLDATAYTTTVTCRAASGSRGFVLTGWSLTPVAATTAMTIQICSGTTVLATCYAPVLAATIQPIPWVVTGVRLPLANSAALALRTGGGAGSVIHGVLFLED